MYTNMSTYCMHIHYTRSIMFKNEWIHCCDIVFDYLGKTEMIRWFTRIYFKEVPKYYHKTVNCFSASDSRLNNTFFMHRFLFVWQGSRGVAATWWPLLVTPLKRNISITTINIVVNKLHRYWVWYIINEAVVIGGGDKVEKQNNRCAFRKNTVKNVW